ncbi:MAG: LPS-assembly protein LptD [Pseudorhodoplanes sp.]|nr:LPS-assembly protein LptD [Pseudorhodoplanes sp.]MCL4711191.1 LPS-assembly protein LptD [Pseudorhodoplanes sp.]GIK79044.1 MAG: LPS-assembly protein LptD [Alphaproteobacteria bacterium]
MAGSTTAHRRICRGMDLTPLRVASLAGAIALALVVMVEPVLAQTNFLTFPSRPPRAKPTTIPKKGEPQPPMLVQADQIHYDYANERVSAVGHVQMYFNGSTIEADKVTYNQRTKRLRAEGNIRFTEADGKITYGEILDLSDDYRDGFVDSLRLDAPENTRFAASRADRTDGNLTVLQSGVYTACAPCKDDPRKPPLWQVKAARITHNEGERTLYFENASIEFFGVPLAYVPYFSTPDPTVKKKSGWLMPIFSSTGHYGVAAHAPYYWVLAPDRDVTITPTITTKQGPMLQAEYRQRLVNGAFMIRGSGIFQQDKDEFRRSDGSTTPGYRNFRGAVESTGQFALNDKWVWGWDAVALTDKNFFNDYGASFRQTPKDPFQTGMTQGTSQVYLTGKGNRSYFDLRAMHFYGFSISDNQKELPVIHPVMDYSYIFGQPVMGGELGFKINLTSLSRDNASFDPITPTALHSNLCGPLVADPAVKNVGNCLLRGVPGTYSRFSTEVNWKRSYTDSFGQIFTPFAYLRADVAAMSISPQPGVANYIDTGDSSFVRGMPTVGIEYRYPFVSVQSWGTQTIEPIAQVIARPNEKLIGKLPNEDAQSLTFDDGNLFRVDKFSGWDRVEGGGRANVGVQYTAQLNRGGFFNVLFGQSYHLFGTNSFAVGDTTNTGLNTGLETTRSDYVARVSYQPDRILTLSTRFRFDEETFAVRRFEIEGRANFDRWSLQALYGNYDKQPELGFLTRREGILGGASVKLNQNWVMQAAARYDLDADRFDQTRIGVGYVDDCFILALNYITSYDYTVDVKKDHRIMLQLNLRTIAGTSFSRGVSGLPGGL